MFTTPMSIEGGFNLKNFFLFACDKCKMDFPKISPIKYNECAINESGTFTETVAEIDFKVNEVNIRFIRNSPTCIF